MYMAGLLGATFGVLLGAQSSFGRLTGYKENAMEVAKLSNAESVNKASA